MNQQIVDLATLRKHRCIGQFEWGDAFWVTAPNKIGF